MSLTPSQTTQILQELGHRPRKQLGQNFLIDANIVQKSVALAEVHEHDNILEIGPGLGTLTRALLSQGARVWAVEFDPKLALHVQRTLATEFGPQFCLEEADALKLPRGGMPDSTQGEGFKVVANLPYAISTPWLEKMIEMPLASRMVLMLQQEAAQRFAAKLGTKQFGAISIFLQSAYEIRPGHKVPASCFHPRPEVESYLFNIVRRAEPFIFDAATRELIRACFQQRRKQIGALLRRQLPDEGRAWITRLAEYGLDQRARPEQIPTKAWQDLASSRI
ncbi:MAG: 16S rRNA (adenine(1518)-N(6)/adenine(1519)-N(6)) -dimethyltransferase RsmA [Synoicihabitans sp.]